MLSYWTFIWPLYHVAVVSSEVLTSFVAQETGQRQVGEYHLRRQETSSCAGHAGYFACPIDLGGGCCPQGLVCGANQACSQPSITSTSTTVFCDQNWFACPPSLGGKSYAPSCHHCRVIGLTDRRLRGLLSRWWNMWFRRLYGVLGVNDYDLDIGFRDRDRNNHQHYNFGICISPDQPVSHVNPFRGNFRDRDSRSGYNHRVRCEWRWLDRGSDRWYRCGSGRGVPPSGGRWVAHHAAPGQDISFHGQV